MTVTVLNEHLTSLLDKHAPVTKYAQKRKKRTPWITPQILVAERERRRAERTWRKSGLTMHKEIFTHTHTHTKDAVTRLVLKTKTDYLNAQIVESQTCKQLFSVTNSLLGKSKVSPLPTNIPAAQLPHSSCEFFTEKIKQIRQNLDNTSRSNCCARYSNTSCSVFTSIRKRGTQHSQENPTETLPT